MITALNIAFFGGLAFTVYSLVRFVHAHAMSCTETLPEDRWLWSDRSMRHLWCVCIGAAVTKALAIVAPI